MVNPMSARRFRRIFRNPFFLSQAFLPVRLLLSHNNANNSGFNYIETLSFRTQSAK